MRLEVKHSQKRWNPLRFFVTVVCVLLWTSIAMAEVADADSIPGPVAVPDSVPADSATVADGISQPMPALSSGDDFMPEFSLPSLVVGPSPDAAAMTLRHDVGIDYSSGEARLSIPLFDWEVGDYPMKLSLAYRVGSYTMDAASGWFGLGWNLGGSGCVTRHIMGLPDEKFAQDIRSASSIGSDPEAYKYLADLHEYRKDDALDRFSYSCPAGAGDFFIKDGVIIPTPQTDNEITFTGDLTDGMRDFMATSPDGTRYIFSEREMIDFQYHQETINHRVHAPSFQNAVSTWYLSRIITPEGADTITITYDSLPEWVRANTVNTSTQSFSYTDRNKAATIDQTTVTAMYDQAVTTFHNQRIIKGIQSRSATVEFTHAIVAKPADNDSRGVITALTVKSPEGTTVRNISTGLSDGFPRYLFHLTISHQGVVIDRHDFTYRGLVPSANKDFFGYYTGYLGNRSSHEVIDPTDATFNSSRLSYDPPHSHTGGMETHMTLQGLMTQYNFEAAKMEYIRRNNVGVPTDTLTIQIGHRLKSIVTTDSVTLRQRICELSYSDPMCDIDFDRVYMGAFVSLSGLTRIQQLSTMLTETTYTTAVSFHDTSLMPGFSVHDASIHYGTVEERISGTGIDRPVMTRYEYDTSPCRMTFMPTSGNGKSDIGILQPHPRFMHTSPVPYNVADGIKHVVNSTTHVSGGFRENIGAKPLLTAVTEFSFENGTYTPLTEKRISYVKSECDSLITGVFHQSLVRSKINIYGEEKSDFQDNTDFNYGNTAVKWTTWLPDTVTTVRTFPDGSTRTSGTRFLYTGSAVFPILIPGGGGTIELPPGFQFPVDTAVVKPAPGLVHPHCPFRADSITSQAYRYTLFGTRTTSAGHTTEHYMARAQNVTTDFFRSAAERGLRSLPVQEIWVVDGRDTITRNYEYGRFGGVTRLTAATITGRGGAVMDHLSVGGYTHLGRPTSVKKMASPTEHYGWGYSGDLLVSRTTGDDTGPQLTSTFTHSPLIGCTSMRAPDGLRTFYAYRGSRLYLVLDNNRELLTRYDYAAFGDTNIFSEPAQCNRVTATVYPDGPSSTPSVTETITDGFGQTIGELSRDFGSEGDVLASLTRYDALNRPLRVWRPPPVNNYIAAMRSDSPLGLAAMNLYSDSLAFSTATYPASALEIPSRTTLPGSDFRQAASTTQLTTCTTQMRDYSRAVIRYTFDGTTVRSDGYYLRGELDCVRTTDADGNVTLTFTDVLGRTVLVRRLTDSYSYADTYTISDSWGNPLVVLPPEASAAIGDWECPTDGEPIDLYAYLYTYDAALRLRSMKAPGREAVEYAYDNEGRVLFTRDGNQRRRGLRTFTLRDALGRDAVIGLCADALSDDIWERDLSATTAPLTVSLSGAVGTGLLGTGYTLTSGEPLSDPRLLQATYYDDSSFLPAGHPALSLPAAGLATPKGHVTGSLTATLAGPTAPTESDMDSDSSAPTLTVSGYDSLGFLSLTARYLPGGRTLLSRLTNSSTGLPIEQSVTLSQADSVIAHTVTSNTYDPYGRLIRSRINPDTPEELTVYEATPGATGEITTERTASVERTVERDIRGAVSSWSTPWISQQLFYGDLGGRPSFTGRVTAKVTTMADGSTRRYDYTYSPLGFLTGAKFSGSDTAKDFSSTYTYDSHGNITSIVQGGLPLAGYETSQVPDLTFTYLGNQITSVKTSLARPPRPPRPVREAELLPEASATAAESRSAAYTGFDYDANGNLTADPMRRLNEIEYNAIDRPWRVITATADTVTFIYSAAGDKLAEIYRSRNGLSDLRRDLFGPYELEDGRLLRTALAQGFIDTLGTIHAFIPDYQGNILAVIDCSTDSLEHLTDYYPYGQPHPDCLAPELSLRKYSAKELLTPFGLDEYDFSARRLTLTGRFTQPDPLGFLSPAVSPYAYCAADPINYIDPSGLFVSRAEALIALFLMFPDYSIRYSGIDDPIHQDALTGQWYVALNRDRNAPYTGGEVLTRYFGPNGSIFGRGFSANVPSVNRGTNYSFSGPMSHGLGNSGGGNGHGTWGAVMIGTNAFGTAVSAKVGLIDYAARGVVGEAAKGMSKNAVVAKAFGQKIGNYTKVARLATYGCAILSFGTAVIDAVDAYQNQDNKRVAKASVDLAMSIISCAGPIGLAASTVYFLIDTGSNGKWIDWFY